ncbi:MAG: undecaprenyl-diphosphate phosphatase [Salinisphaeraceae bacterium]
MDLLQLLVLALIQGVTEFLPISSSAHLILVPVVTGWPDQGLAFDLAVHLGTLVAVLGYFRHDVARMLRAWVVSLAGHGLDADARLAWGVILATLPAVGVGTLLGVTGESLMRQPWIVALASIVFGVLLGWVDWRARSGREIPDLGLRGFLGIGVAQAVALIPGASRSGMTIMAGRALGLSRQDAARVSFFLAMPITVAAIAYETGQLIAEPMVAPWGMLSLAAFFAAVAAWITIHLFLALLQRVGMMPFVIYRIVLGVVLLAVFGFEP